MSGLVCVMTCVTIAWSNDDKDDRCIVKPWWSHQMETFSALLALCVRNSPITGGQWRGALMFSLICAWIKDWVNNREAGDLKRHCAHYDVIVMLVREMYQNTQGWEGLSWPYRWLRARLHLLQCVSNGVTSASQWLLQTCARLNCTYAPIN